MMRGATLSLGLLAVLSVAGCASNDIGKSCQARAAEALPAEPIGGEHPASEIVAVQRSSDCETFQCLSHRGYDPYCTRTCEYDSSTKRGECPTGTECKRPLHCYQGYCQDDDCPDGFECRPVQEAGPLAGQLFCVHKEGCNTSNIECEALGDVKCQKLACFDSGLLPGATAPGALACVNPDTVPYCRCPGESGESDARACVHPVCDPENADRWPENSTEFRDVCLLEEP